MAERQRRFSRIRREHNTRYLLCLSPFSDTPWVSSRELWHSRPLPKRYLNGCSLTRGVRRMGPWETDIGNTPCDLSPPASHASRSRVSCLPPAFFYNDHRVVHALC